MYHPKGFANTVVVATAILALFTTVLTPDTKIFFPAAAAPLFPFRLDKSKLLKRSNDEDGDSFAPLPLHNKDTKHDTRSRIITDFSHLHDDRELSVFVTITISSKGEGAGGQCQATIMDAHTLPAKPAHPWYTLYLGGDQHGGASIVPIKNLTKIVPPLASSTPKSKSTRFFLVTIDNINNAKDKDGKKDVRQAFMFQDPREMHAHDMSVHSEGHVKKSTSSAAANLVKGHHHDGSGDEDKVHDVLYTVDSATQNVYFPPGTRKALLYCDTTNHSVAIVLDIATHMTKRGGGADLSHNRRRFLPSSDNDIEARSISEVAPPADTLNIVFVSGGYLLEDKEIFFQNVSDLFAMMQTVEVEDDSDISDMHRSVPHNRYIDFWNIYAVFQPSVDRSASRPLYNIELNNNLECVHPAQMERGLACRWELAQSLADVSPAGAKARPGKTLVIALVNDPLYGGTGSYLDNVRHFGTFFNGYDITQVLSDKKRMLSLMDHEIGHAYGGLADEYVAISGSDFDDEEYENCQMGSGSSGPSTASTRWKWWIQEKATDPSGFHSTYGNGVINPNWGISDTPVATCFYQNYYRPNENCMMNRLNDYFMCPVCREAASVNIMKNRFSLLWPRYPLEDNVLVASAADAGDDTRISTNSTAVLHLSQFLTSANDFTLSVTYFNGTAIPIMTKPECPACIQITPEMWSAFPVDEIIYINVSVVDNSKFISDPLKRAKVDAGQFTQSGSFRLMVVSDISTAEAYATTNGGTLSLYAGADRSTVGKDFDSDRKDRYMLCVSVDPTRNATCNMSFPNQVYQAAIDIDGELSAYDVWVFGIMGGLAVAFIGLWICACGKFSNTSRGVVRPIFRTEFNCVIQIVRIMMMLSAVGFMVAAFATLGISSYYYTKLSVLGKVVIFAGIAMALLLYILAFVGFWSVYSRSKRMLCINLLCLVIAMGFQLTLVILIQTWANDIEDLNSTLNQDLQDYWNKQVSEDPERICGIQNELQCSGYNHSCATIVGSSNECPKNCEETNARWFSPCQYIIQDWITTNHVILVQLLYIAVGLLCVGIFFDIVTWIALRSMKLSIQRGNSTRVKQVSQSVGVSKESGKKYKSILLLMSLSSRDTVRLKKEFARIDKDKSGTLDKLEMLAFLKKSLMHTPTREEIDEIFAICDIDGDQVIDLREFLALFQHSAVSSDKYSKIMHERLSQRGLLRKNSGVLNPEPFSSPDSSPATSPRNSSPNTASPSMNKPPPRPVREASLTDFL